MKHLKYFESSTAKFNHSVIDDIESLSVDYLDEGWFISISVYSQRVRLVYSKICSHQKTFNGEVINVGKWHGDFTGELTYKFMIFWAVSDEEVAQSHMAYEEENDTASEEVLDMLKQLHPDEDIRLDIYQEEE